MNKSLIVCDRVMYGSLLVMIAVLPYSLAMIAICQATMALTWVANFVLSTWQKVPVERFKLTSSSIFWPLAGIAVLIAVMIPFSHYPSLSFKKLGTRYLFQIVLMCLVTRVVCNRKRLHTVLTVLLLTFFPIIIDIIVQYMVGKSLVHHTPLMLGRITGPMNQANDLGTLLVAVLPVVLVSMIITKKNLWRLLLAVLLLLLMAALGLTVSRGAWVAFAVSMIALGAFLKCPKYAFSIILTLAVFFWVFGMYCLSSRLDIYDVPIHRSPALHPSFSNPWGLPVSYHAFAVFSDPSGRGTYWETAINVIKHNPWFGCGYSAYIQTLRDLHITPLEYPHNSLLHITAELGFVGLALHIWLFGALCFQGWKVLRTISVDRELYVLGCGLTCGIMAWFTHSLLDTPWSSLQLSLLLWLLIGILLSLDFVLANHKGEKTCP